MTVIQLMYGNPVMNVKGICEQFHISDRTARKHMKEIEENHERYGDYAVMGEGALKTEDEYLQIIEEFYRIIEKDILAVAPGKLYINEYYLRCYISGDIKQDAFKGILFQIKNLTLVTDCPFWIKETTYQYLPEKPNQVEYTTLEKGILLLE